MGRPPLHCPRRPMPAPATSEPGPPEAIAPQIARAAQIAPSGEARAAGSHRQAGRAARSAGSSRSRSSPSRAELHSLSHHLNKRALPTRPVGNLTRADAPNKRDLLPNPQMVLSRPSLEPKRPHRHEIRELAPAPGEIVARAVMTGNQKIADGMPRAQHLERGVANKPPGQSEMVEVGSAQANTETQSEQASP